LLRFIFYPLLSLVVLSFLFSGCETDFHPVGKRLFESQQFVSGKQRFPVYTYQKRNQSVQANGLPTAQLGKIEHPIFGISTAKIISALTISPNPRFGSFRQSQEDRQENAIQEDEQVTQVFLELPFFTNQIDEDNDGVIDSLDSDATNPNSDTDGDGISDLAESQGNTNPLSSDSDGDGIPDSDDSDNANYDPENSVYAIDSIYGNRFASFNLKVYELTYFLNELDPSNNFESQEVYYTDQDLSKQGFTGALLADHRLKLNFEEVRINYETDNPDTPDVDETTRAETRLTPRIRIPLDKEFFQERIISMEGSEYFETAGKFREYFKGIIIQPEVDTFTDDLYLILDINNAVIRIDYQYNKNDESSNTVIVDKGQYLINVNGLRLNILENNSFDEEISERIVASNQGQSVDRIYIQGGHFHGSLRLFDNLVDDEINGIIEDLKKNNWLINEANLVCYVDPSTPKEFLLAERLYLYNLKTGMPLSDYSKSSINSQNSRDPDPNREQFGGILETDDSGNPISYKFRLTDHIYNILRDGAENVELGLVAISDINNTISSQAIWNDNQAPVKEFPQSAIINPLGVILIGSNPQSILGEKEPTLEIIYTEL